MIVHACMHSICNIALIVCDINGTFCIKYKYVTPYLFFSVVCSFSVMYEIVFSLCSDDDVQIEVAQIIVPPIILIKLVDVFFMGWATNGRLLCKVCGALKCISMNNSRLPPSDAEK